MFVLFPLGVEALDVRTINYQGYLTDSSGNAVNGQVDMSFALYAAASGGPALWSETHAGVVVTKGVYSVVLGNASPTPNPITLPFDVQYFLGITVGAGPEMIQRQALTAVPYAFRAKLADGVGSSVQIPASQIGSGTASISISGNAATASQLSANPANCSPGSVAAGIAANGVAEGCVAASSGNTANAIVQRDASGNFVAGTVTAGDFAFASAKTRYLSLPPAAFVPASNNAVMYGSLGDGAYVTTGTEFRLFAPLSLPNGVTLTEVRCGLGNNGGGTMNLQVLSKPRISSAVDTVMSGSVSPSVSIQDVGIAGSVVIDAVNNVYTISVNTSTVCLTNCKVAGCRIAYTETSVH